MQTNIAHKNQKNTHNMDQQKGLPPISGGIPEIPVDCVAAGNEFEEAMQGFISVMPFRQHLGASKNQFKDNQSGRTVYHSISAIRNIKTSGTTNSDIFWLYLNVIQNVAVFFLNVAVFWSKLLWKLLPFNWGVEGSAQDVAWRKLWASGQLPMVT